MENKCKRKEAKGAKGAFRKLLNVLYLEKISSVIHVRTTKELIVSDTYLLPSIQFIKSTYTVPIILCKARKLALALST